jgi:peptidoglycan/xylan/chitin deacetylase (PgdA/CDA1 family)
MLNYRNTTVSFFFLVLTIIVFGTADILLFSLVAILYISLLALGSARIQMNFYLKSVNRGSPDEAKVALTFDDGPDEKTTSEILDILEKHQIKATFFCIGNKIEENKDILKRISDNGHIIGNHSWSHAFFFDFFTPGKMILEINKTGAIIEKVTGKYVNIFRPPYGVTNPFLSKAIKKTRHTVIGWSLRTLDTIQESEKVLEKLEKQLKNGDIILLHDTQQETVRLLDNAIMVIKNKGLEIVRLDELISIN